MIAKRKEELRKNAQDLEDALAAKEANESTGKVSQVLSIVQDALQDKAIASGSSRPVDLGKTIAMCDVSGSMSGVPMFVSIALGILCSELSHPAYKDRVLSFSSEPSWRLLGDCRDFVDKVQHVRESDWGCSTDIYKAMELVLSLVEEKKLSSEDVPNLLIISDMQFNSASDAEPSTLYENLTKLFAQAGEKLYGKPLDLPQIIFWNVKDACNGFHAPPDAPGITMLSGFSPAMLKFVLSGELQQELFESTRKQSARDMLVNVLEEEGLAPVRAALDKMDEKMFLV
ncbi:hypothetical protein GUITHDRAFT_94088 [Guillardia theta CCMP2712]|uniref:DUF7788 domain-containing protein n=1 Tax=Guillardia theta (strain CCMP2712) TaxID=905079 RepID=L1JF71_GUITC|nr:hypothetical protein GUITHDRAFT_94088 [Guillardia theta CCMP2712]EKX47188.1 hypothetical protein GUITHDRAFT_94088 [Guillardia theta CCMP2712]|eukprot:XP_005834168.1 hypothetical protein GUITHDRAFT_94088 [Guillardia theta CCMP2712]